MSQDGGRYIDTSEEWTEGYREKKRAGGAVNTFAFKLVTP